MPIIIGKHLKKGILAHRDEKGCDMVVVWLSQEYESGRPFDLGDIRGVNAVMHFCDRSSLQITIDVLNRMLKNWKEGNDERMDQRG